MCFYEVLFIRATLAVLTSAVILVDEVAENVEITGFALFARSSAMTGVRPAWA